MIYKHLPCQILGHDFDEKSEFLDYELSIKTAHHYSIKKWPSSKESWVEGGCDVIQSRHLNKRGYLSMQKRSAMVMFYPWNECEIIYISSTFLCLCPHCLTIRLNLNILKKAY